MGEPLYELELHSEVDVFAARQAGREIAEAVGMDGQDVVRVATALSEVSRDVVTAGGGEVTFVERPPNELCIQVVTLGQAARLQQQGGVQAAARLVSALAVHTDDTGHAVITLTKRVAHPVVLGQDARTELRRRVSAGAQRAPIDELRAQNRELIVTLEEVEARRDELVTLNNELEETNRGVMALYDELSGELETTNQGVVALYAQIDDKNRQLRDASESKTRFLRNISHELRTPGNSVLGLSRLLLDADGDPLSQDQRQQVTFIEASAIDLVQLVNELLDLARAESGRVEPTLADIDLAELFGSLRGTTRPLVTRPKVSLVVDDAAAAGVIRTDETLLAHVLRNLLSNAVKFTQEGEVRMSVVRDGTVVRFTVSDTGIGIDEDDLAHVFEEFFQVRTPLHAGVKGSGLGLPYAKRLATILGGDLSVTSAAGQGTTFVVELPVDGPSAEPEEVGGP